MRYTPSVDEGERAYIDGLSGTSRTRAESAAEYRRMIAAVERAAAAKAYELGRLDERHDCNITSLYHGSVVSAEQLQRDLRSRNPYIRREETE